MARREREQASKTDPIQYRNLTTRQQAAARGVMSKHTRNLSGGLEAEGSARSVRAAALARDSRFNLDQAARNRVDLMRMGATDPNLRMPGDRGVPGSGWYFDAHRNLRDNSPAGTDMDVLASASSAMSPQNAPETEQAAATAIARARDGGYVRRTEELSAILQSSGVDDSWLQERTAFTDIPSEVMPRLKVQPRNDAPDLPDIRSAAQRASEGVEWGEIAKGGMNRNIAKANEALAGRVAPDDVQDARTAPKTKGYAKAIKSAIPADPDARVPLAQQVDPRNIENEYHNRMEHVGRVMRGEQAVGQGVLDLYGLQESREGILDPEGHTAEDTWMQGVSIRDRLKDSRGNVVDELVKSGGDVEVSAKTHRGVSISGDPDVGGVALRHAMDNEATIRAAEMVGEELRTNFAVPAVGVQETSWTVQRRLAGADTAFNEMQREQGKSAPRTSVPSGTDELFTAAGNPTQRARVTKAERKRYARKDPEQEGLF